MSRKHLDARGKQKGAQAHPEGAHGEKTWQRLIEELQSRPETNARHAGVARHNPGAKSRLFSRREQHDEADLNSEKNRLDRDIREHRHIRENFQVRGGAESHPVMPRSHIDPEHPDAPNPGSTPSPDEIPQRVR